MIRASLLQKYKCRLQPITIDSVGITGIQGGLWRTEISIAMRILILQNIASGFYKSNVDSFGKSKQHTVFKNNYILGM